MAAGPIVVSVGGNDYTISSQSLPYLGNEAQFQAQPWWGDGALAVQIAGAMQYQLGNLIGGPGDDPNDPGIPSALIAYGTSGGDVSIAYWDGATENCPSGCPSEADTYFYVFGSVAPTPAPAPEQVPALPLAGLLTLAALLGALGIRRLKRA